MKHLKKYNEKDENPILEVNESSMSPIPTAEEFLALEMKKCGEEKRGIELPKILIEFAKLHVEMALKAASEDANMDDDYYQSLQVYPLENIK